MKFKNLFSLLLSGAIVFIFVVCAQNIKTENNSMLYAQAASYNPSASTAYAKLYWSEYNDASYHNFNSDGGDCANFVSQCLHAGGLQMTSGWYYNSYSDHSSSWTYCPSMYNYFKSAGYTIIENPSSSQVLEGNPVLYWREGNWAHAAICTGKNSSGTPVVAAHNNDRWNVEWTLGYSRTCTILINKTPTSTPSMVKPTISTNKSSYVVGDTVTITWVPSPANSEFEHYWVQLFDPDGTQLYNANPGNTTTFSFKASKAGNYSVTVYATPKNSPQGEGSLTDTKKITVTSNKPSSCSLKLSTNGIKAGNSITFTASATNAKSYYLYVKKDSGSYTKYSMSSGKLTLTFNDGGHYSAYAQAVNDGGTCNSSDYAFDVDPYLIVKLDADGGICAAPSLLLTYNKAYGTLPTPEKDGYTFDGWYTAKTGGTRVTSSTIVTNPDDHTLYAHWTGKDVTITLIDELRNDTSQFMAKYGDKFNVGIVNSVLPSLGQVDPTAGKILIGWSKTSNGIVSMRNGDIITPIAGQPIDSITLYARWVAPKLSLKVNGQTSYEAKPGETLSVTLEMEDADLAYSSAVYVINYSPSLEYQRCIKSESYLDASYLHTELKQGEPFICFVFSRTSDTARDGILATFEFKVPEDAERGTNYEFNIIKDDKFSAFENAAKDEIGKKMEEYLYSHTKGCSASVREFSIGATEITLENGQQYAIQANEENLTYVSNNTNVAVVSKNGVVTAVGEGNAIISVINSNSEVKQLKVKVVPVVEINGDCNGDGVFNADDVALLERWLLTEDKTIENWKAADLCEDGVLDVYDLILMRRKLMEG